MKGIVGAKPFGRSLIRLVVMLTVALLMLNIAAMFISATEMNISSLQTYDANWSVISWVKNGDKVYVNVTATATGSPGDHVFVNVSSDSDIKGIWVNCTYNSSKYFHGTFTVSAATSSNTSKNIIAASGEDIYLCGKTGSPNYKTIHADYQAPATVMTNSPTTRIDYAGKVFINASCNVLLTANDGSGSGFKMIRYKIGDGGWTNSTANPTMIPLAGRVGANYLTYYAIDVAGNQENATTAKLVILRDLSGAKHTVALGTTETYTNESVICNDLEVRGELIFKNVTYFAKPVNPKITVMNTGSFNATDNDGKDSTTADATIFTGSTGGTYYKFIVEADGRLRLMNSFVYECGYSNTDGQRGLTIRSDHVTISNNTLSGQFSALDVSNAAPVITGNKFLNNRVSNPDNGYGVYVKGNGAYPVSTLKITGNTFDVNSTYAVWAQDVGTSPTRGKGSLFSSNGTGLKNRLSTVANLTGKEFPVLTFFDYAVLDGINANGTLWISIDAGATFSPLFYAKNTGQWTRHSIDLRAYKNKTATLVWNYTTKSSTTDPGWYVDMIEVKSLDEMVSRTEDMEFLDATPAGGDDTNPYHSYFVTDDEYSNCEWQHGTPSFTLTSAANGSYCWGTDLSGYTDNDQYSQMIFDSQFLCAGGDLTFWHYYSTESSNVGGNVQITTDGGATWNVLDPKGYPTASVSSLDGAPGFTGNSAGWVKAKLDMDDYMGEYVLIKFVYGDTLAGNSLGWYIDDVAFTQATSKTTISWLCGDDGINATKWNVTGWFDANFYALDISENTVLDANEPISLRSCGLTAVKNNVIFASALPSASAGHAITAMDTGIEAIGNTVTDQDDLYTQGVYVQLGAGFEASDMVWVSNNAITGMNRSGAAAIITVGGDVAINGNYINDTFSGIHAYSSVRSNIDQNTIHCLGGNALSVVGAIDADVSLNTITAAGMNGIYLYPATEANMIQNTISHCGLRKSGGENYGILIQTNRLVATSLNNVMYSDGDGIYLEENCNVVMNNDRSTYNNASGLYVSKGCRITANIGNFSNNVEYGVYLTDLNTTDLMTSLYVYKNGLDGIFLHNARINIEQSQCYYNKGDGIFVEDSVGTALNNGNKFHDNDGDGLHIENSLAVMVDGGGNSFSKRNKGDGIDIIDSKATLKNLQVTLNEYSGIKLTKTAAGPASAVDDWMLILQNTTSSSNLDYGLLCDYTGTASGYQMYVLQNGNQLSYNGLVDLLADDNTRVVWRADFSSASANSVQRFDGEILVKSGKALTMLNLDLTLTGDDDTITAESNGTLTIDKCRISSDSAWRFKSQGPLYLTNSTIEGAESIYVSSSTYALFYGDVISDCSNGLYIYQSKANIINCRIERATYKGIFVSGCNPLIRSTTISECYIGLYAVDTLGLEMEVRSSTLDNNDYALQLLGARLKFVNSTVSESGILDAYLTSYSNRNGRAYMLNSQFDPSKVSVADSASYLERAWYLNAYAGNEAGAPLFNATVTLLSESGKGVNYRTQKDGWAYCLERKELRVDRTKTTYDPERNTTAQAKMNTSSSIATKVTMNATKSLYLTVNLNPYIIKKLGMFNMTEDVPAMYALDLDDYFGDYEKLAYTYVSQGNMAVDISDNGSISLTPAKDWFGTENVTFTAKDSAGASTWGVLTVVVQPENDAPVVSDIVITPQEPTSKQGITANFKVADPDGGTGEIITLIYWYKDGEKVEDMNYKTTVDQTMKGEVWYCQIIASDGITSSGLFTSPNVTIRNSKPSISEASISPQTAYKDTRLSALVKDPYDVDDVTVTYLYQWQKKVDTQWKDIESATQSTLDSSKFVKNDEIRVVVTPFDGTDNGYSKESSPIKVRNSPPTLDSITISPAVPRVDSPQVTAYPVGAFDKDGDQIVFDYKWKLQLWPIPLSDEPSLNLTKFTLSAGDILIITIQPTDAEEGGAEVSLSFNLSEADRDGDGIGDSQDDDRDGDGYDNEWETSVGTDPDRPESVPSGDAGLDSDGDGTPDLLDTDDDGDTALDMNDAFPKDPAASRDTDHDGMPDDWNAGKDSSDSTTGLVLDQDDDNDGFSDALETAEGYDTKDPKKHPPLNPDTPKINFTMANVLLVFILIILVIVLGLGGYVVYRYATAPPPKVEMKTTGATGASPETKGILEYLKRLTAATTGVQDLPDVANIDLDKDLVECSSCGELVPSDSSSCPQCGSSFAEDEGGDGDEDLVTGEPPEEEEEERDLPPPPDDEEDAWSSPDEDEEAKDSDEEKPKKEKPKKFKKTSEKPKKDKKPSKKKHKKDGEDEGDWF